MTSLLKASIYDGKIRLIRILASKEVAGYQEEVIWDGFDDIQQRARIGVDVVILEASHWASGSNITAKAFVTMEFEQ